MRLSKKFPIIITIFLFLAIYLIGKLVPEESIRYFINKGGVLSPVIFIILSLLTNIVAPLSGTPIIFAGFYIFGNNVVFLITVASFISFMTNFWIARIWGRPIVGKLAGKEKMHKVDKLTQNYGLLMLFFLRIFQGGIHDFISYASGLTSIQFLPYMIISSIAIVPGTLLWYYFSLQISTPAAFTVLTLILVAVFSSMFILGTIAIQKLKKGGRVR